MLMIVLWNYKTQISKILLNREQKLRTHIKVMCIIANEVSIFTLRTYILLQEMAAYPSTLK